MEVRFRFQRILYLVSVYLYFPQILKSTVGFTGDFGRGFTGDGEGYVTETLPKRVSFSHQMAQVKYVNLNILLHTTNQILESNSKFFISVISYFTILVDFFLF